MFFGLRHPAVVRRDNDQCQIDRADTRDHVLYEIFVPRHVNDTEQERWKMDGLET